MCEIVFKSETPQMQDGRMQGFLESLENPGLTQAAEQLLGAVMYAAKTTNAQGKLATSVQPR